MRNAFAFRLKGTNVGHARKKSCFKPKVYFVLVHIRQRMHGYTNHIVHVLFW